MVLLRASRRWAVLVATVAVAAMVTAGVLVPGSARTGSGSATTPGRGAHASSSTAGAPPAPRRATGEASGNAGSGATAAQAISPAQVEAQLVALYQEIYSTAQDAQLDPALKGAAPQLPDVTQFQKAVASLTPSQAASLASAAQRTSGWGQVPSEVSKADQAIRQASSAAASAGASSISPQSGSSKPSPGGGGSPSGGTGSLPSQNFSPSSPVAGFQPAGCPIGSAASFYSQSGLDALFGLTVATDTVSTFKAAFPENWIIVVFFVIGVDPDPINVILSLTVDGLKAIADVLQYLYNQGSDCSTANQTGILANIDNTAYQAFVLLGLINADEVQISSQVDTVRQQAQAAFEVQLRRSVESSLSSASAVPPVAFELPTCDGGYLGGGGCGGSSAAVVCPAGFATPSQVSVQEVVTCDVHAVMAAGQPTDPAALSELAMADQAATSGQYKVAYGDYRTAYQDATQ